VANSNYTFEQVGELNLKQMQCLQEAILEKIKMTVSLFGGVSGVGRGRSRSADVTYTPDQFDALVKAKQKQLGKTVLSLDEVL